MIDWMTARISIRSAATLNTGEVSAVDADGALEWVSPRRTSVRGSHSGTIWVKRVGNGSVEFAGSPAKFLQGHNIFGSDDLQALGAEMIERACGSLGLELLAEELIAIRDGQYEVKRVDINYSFATGSRANALAWIEKAAAVGTLQNRGKGRLRKSTVTWGECSRHWKLKVYSKGQEIAAKDHGLPEALPMRTQLATWCDDKLRIELELHARQLRKLGLERASSWRAGHPWELFREYLAKLRLGEDLMLGAATVQSLPYRLRPTYSNWARGEDLLQLMSRPTYYRHRRELLEVGINIAAPPCQDQAPTISLSQYLETPCRELPLWAIGTELYCNPRQYDDEGAESEQGGVRVRRQSGVTSTGEAEPSDAGHAVLISVRRRPPLESDRGDGALCS